MFWGGDIWKSSYKSINLVKNSISFGAPAMPTKFQRDHRETDSLPAHHRARFHFQRRMHLGNKQRLMLMYVVILLFALLVLLPSAPLLTRRPPAPALMHTRGTVLAKKAAPAPAGTLHLLGIAFDDARGLSHEVTRPMPAEYWHAFEPGDAIGLVYRVAEDGAGIEVVEVGLVALPD